MSVGKIRFALKRNFLCARRRMLIHQIKLTRRIHERFRHRWRIIFEFGNVHQRVEQIARVRAARRAVRLAIVLVNQVV